MPAASRWQSRRAGPLFSHAVAVPISGFVKLPKLSPANAVGIVSVGSLLVLVPIILNMGFGYIDTIARIGDGEDVSPTYMQDAATQGIKPGQTSQQVEQVLGRNSEPVPSDTPGERCKGYPMKGTGQHMVICYAIRPVGPAGEQRWLVTRSYLKAG